MLKDGYFSTSLNKHFDRWYDGKLSKKERKDRDKWQLIRDISEDEIVECKRRHYKIKLNGGDDRNGLKKGIIWSLKPIRSQGDNIRAEKVKKLLISVDTSQARKEDNKKAVLMSPMSSITSISEEFVVDTIN
ncbi:unnamed protein product [Rhizophagus irregularis]|nr:unnamed protein product [Rhizophagus irregularis]